MVLIWIYVYRIFTLLMKYFFGVVQRRTCVEMIVEMRLFSLGNRRWALGTEKRTVQIIGLEKLLFITSDILAQWAVRGWSNLKSRKLSSGHEIRPTNLCIYAMNAFYKRRISIKLYGIMCTIIIPSGSDDRVKRVFRWCSVFSALSLCFFIRWTFDFKSINAAGHLRSIQICTLHAPCHSPKSFGKSDSKNNEKCNIEKISFSYSVTVEIKPQHRKQEQTNAERKAMNKIK